MVGQAEADFTIRDEGTLVLLTPETPAAEAWISEHIDLDEAQWFGKALVIEHRYAQDIMNALLGEHFVIQTPTLLISAD